MTEKPEVEVEKERAANIEPTQSAQEVQLQTTTNEEQKQQFQIQETEGKFHLIYIEYKDSEFNNRPYIQNIPENEVIATTIEHINTII